MVRMMAYKAKKLPEVKIPKVRTLEEIYKSALSKVDDVTLTEQAFDALVKTSVQTSPEAATVVGIESIGATPMPPAADRVGSVVQKESAALAVGLTRAKYIAVIVELLSAGEVRRDWVKEPGEEVGRWVETFVPNLDKRAKGAELAGKFFNDYKEQVTTTGNTYNKIVVQWLNAPSAGVVANRV